MQASARSYRSRFLTGLVGTVLVALCCFTPILVIALGALGLGAATGWLDWILLPVLVILAAVSARAYRQWRRATARERAGGAP
ncbi:MAG: mercury resistance system transport protein MerF [Armatimonadetes bacterium]|nr:mercury resistance system transport protein MerF [Armatimonadota bacterium]